MSFDELLKEAAANPAKLFDLIVWLTSRDNGGPNLTYNAGLDFSGHTQRYFCEFGDARATSSDPGQAVLKAAIRAYDGD